MKIFMPNKKFLKFSYVLIPFHVILFVMAFIALHHKDEILFNAFSVCLVLLVLIFTVGTRLIRKDNMVITEEQISYGVKHEKIGYFRILLTQIEKNTIFLKDIEKLVYHEQSKVLTLHTKQGVIEIWLKDFTKGVIKQIINILNERTNNG